jgi:hypothetical protein
MPCGLRQSHVKPMKNGANLPTEQTVDALLLGGIKQGFMANFAIDPAPQESRQTAAVK